MIKRLSVSEAEHNEFVSRHAHSDLMQTTYWGKLKEINHWRYVYVDVGTEDGKLTGAALVMFRKAGIFTLAYCPHGYVVDWQDLESLKVLDEEVVKECRRAKAFALHIDPEVSVELQACKTKLEALGFEHTGYTTGLSGPNFMQPRFTVCTPLEGGEEAVWPTLNSRCRHHVRYAEDHGLEVKEYPASEMARFSRLMATTGDRNEFSTRPQSYFERMFEAFPEKNRKLLFVEMNPKKSIDIEHKRIARSQKQIKRLKRKENLSEGQLTAVRNLEQSIERSNELIHELEAVKEDCVTLSGGIYIHVGRVVYYLYGASSNDFRDFMPNYLMVWTMMKQGIADGAELFDFCGISGREGREDDDAPGLYEFKKLWGSYKHERIGEFVRVFAPVRHKLFNFLLNLRRKL